MLAEHRTRTVVHHEWTLQTPAHYTDVAAAVNAAVVARDNDPNADSSVLVTIDDDVIVIGYRADQPPQPKAASRAVGLNTRALRKQVGWTMQQLAPKARLADVLTDLDRCEHGRHEGDDCGSCGGASQGNPHAPAGQVIGYGLYGDLIVRPRREVKHDPDAWRQRR